MSYDGILFKLRATRRVLAVLLVWSPWNLSAAECAPDSSFIHFNFHRIIETETESRYLRTDAQFNDKGFIQYMHDDEAIGSISSVAIDKNDYYVDRRGLTSNARNWYTTEGIRRLIKGLAHRGFFELKSGPEPEEFEYPFKYSLWLYLSCDEVTHSVRYSSERDAAPAARVLELMQRYLDRRLRLRAVKKSRLETESDVAPPLNINIVKLFRNPKLYDGKRIKVSGKFVHELENVSLSDTGIPEIRLWVDSTPSTFGSVEKLKPYSGAKVSMEGIFVTGMRGHFGMWKGELKRVTKVERLE